MSRLRARVAATVAVATVLAVTGLSDAAVADAVTTAPTGSLVIQEDTTFLQQSAAAGIVAVALPGATPGFSTTAGFSASFPVTGGAGSLTAFYGNVQLGGGLLLVDVRTGQTAIFNNLAFSIDNWAITGVPLGETAPVNLLDPAGASTITKSGTTQLLNSPDLEVDPQGAQYVDTKLNTTFFVAGQHTGTLSLSFTPGS